MNLNPSVQAVVTPNPAIPALTLDNTGFNVSGRLMSGATPANINFNNAVLSFVGNNTPGVLTAETLGTVTLNPGASFISSANGLGVGAMAQLTINTLNRNQGSTLGFLPGVSQNFSQNISNLNTPFNQILVNSFGPGAAMVNGILPYATVASVGATPNQFDFATTVAAGTASSIAAFTNYKSSLAAAGPTDTVRLTASETLASNKVVNAILFAGTTTNNGVGSITINQNTGSNNLFTLGVTSGAIMAMGNNTLTITGGTVDFGSAEGILNENNANITFNSAIAGTNGLTISATAAGQIALNPSFNGSITGGNGVGSNTYLGNTWINGTGTGLVLTNSISGFSNGTVVMTAGELGNNNNANLAIPNPFVFNNSLVSLGDNNRTTFTGPMTLTGTNTFSLANFGNGNQNPVVLGGVISGTGSLNLIQGGNGLILANPDNIYSGGTGLTTGVGGSNGQLQVTASSVLDSAGHLLSGPLGTGPLNLMGGVLQNTNTNGNTTEYGANLVTLYNAVNILSTPTSINNAAATGQTTIIGGGNADGGGDINLAGPVTLAGNTNTISVSNNVNFSISGVISGTGALTKINTGLLFLDGANTFTGGDNITAGTVIVGNSAALGTGLVTINGGTLQDSGRNSYTFANQVVMSGAATINAINPATTLTFSGNISGTGALTKTGPGKIALTTADTYTGATTITGGTLALSGGGALLNTASLAVSNISALTPAPSTYVVPSPGGVNAVQTLTFSTGITGGTFTLTFNGLTTAPITFSATAATLAANIQAALTALPNVGPNNTLVAGTGPFTVTFQNGLGGTNVPTLTFNAAGLAGGSITSIITTTTGDTAQTNSVGGTLTLDNTAGNNINRLNDAAAITLAGGTLNVLGAANAASTELIGAITLNAGQSQIQTTAGTGGSIALTSSATLTRNAGSDINFVAGGGQTLGSATNQIIFNVAPTTLLTGTTNGIVKAATVTDAATGGFNLATATGTTTSSIAAVTTYQTLMAGGGNAATDNVLVTASTAMTAADTVQAILIRGDSITVSGSALTVGSGLIASSGGTTTGDTISAPVTLAAVEGVIVNGAGSTLNLTGAITGTAGITFGGSGTTNVGVANTYTGTTTLNSGTLGLGIATALASGTGQVNVDGGTLQTTAAGLTIANPVALNTGPGALTVTGTNSLTLSGVLSGAGSLIENMPAVTSTIAASPTGATETGAQVTITTTAAHPFVVGETVTIAGVGVTGFNGTFEITSVPSTTSFTYTDPNVGLAASGGGTATATAALTLAGAAANTFTGSTIVDNGALVLGKTAAVGAVVGPLVIGDGVGGTNADAVIQTGQSGQVTNSVVVNSSGVLNLIGVNDTLASLLLNGGNVSTLPVAAAAAFGTLTLGANVESLAAATPASISGLLVLNGNRIFDVNPGGSGNDLNVSSLISGGNEITKTGTGTLTFNGYQANTYSGQTTVAEGTLNLGMQGNLPAYAGPLVVGDYGNTATVQITTPFNQTNSGQSVYVTNSGVLDLSATPVSQTIGTLEVRGGSVNGPANNIVQDIVLNATNTTVTGGTFTLSFNGQTTPAIAQNGAIVASANGAVVDGSGNVTIVTTGVHGFTVGQMVTIAGVGVAAYNGTYMITAVPTPFTFTYMDTAAIGSAASGGGTVNLATIATGGAVELGNVVTITTAAAHGFTVGQTVMIQGITPTGYNGIYTITAVPTPTSFTYTSPYYGLANSTAAGTAFLATNSALAIQNALSQLPNVGAGNVTVTPIQGIGLNFQVTFQGNLLTGSTVPLLSLASVPTGAANATANVGPALVVTGATVTGLASTTSGSISSNLLLNNNPTGFNVADSGSVQALNISGAIVNNTGAAVGITKSGAGTLVLSGNLPNTYSGTQTVTVAGTSTNNVGTYVQSGTLLLADTGGLALPSTTVVVGDGLAGSGTTKGATLRYQATFQSIVFGTNVTGGTFALTFNGQTTAAISWSTTAATLASNIQSALAALSNVGTGNVTVTGTGPFTVTFAPSVANQTPMFVASNLLTPSGTAISVNSQLPANAGVQVNSSGLYDLNGNANQILSGSILPQVLGATTTALNISGGTVSTGSTGLLTLGGNVFGQANLSNVVPATINGNLSLGGVTRLVDVQAGALPGAPNDMIINAQISNGGAAAGLNKLDAGKLQLAGNNTYTGPTTVSAGTLLIDGTQPNSPVTVLTGAILGGTGTAGGITTLGGTVNPGDPITSKATLNAGATNLSSGNLTVQLSGSTGSFSSDLLNLGSNILTLGGSSTLTVDLAGLTTTTGAPITVIQDGGNTGTFTHVLVTNNPNNFQVSVSYTANAVKVTVNAAPATHFTVTAPSSASRGVAFDITVTALDSFNNVATGYVGTVHFTTTDMGMGVVVPANYTFVAGDNGVHTFTGGVTLVTAGNQTVTATDTTTSTITGTSAAIAVTAPAAATHFGVTAPATASVGSAVSFTVTALDASNNPTTGYTGTVHFTSTDGTATLPANAMLTNGVGTFNVTFQTAGNQTVTATDTTTSSITGTSNTVMVSTSSNPATHFLVSAPSSATAGAAFSFTVTALDASNNPVSGYLGTVHFTKSDSGTGSAVPADYTFVVGDHGVHTFTGGATFVTAGSQTLTATDTVTSTITGSATVTVAGATAATFTVSAPSSATAGTAFLFTVTAKDSFGNTATGYAGTIHFTSTDAAAILPANATLTNGTSAFIATMKTTGSQTLTATDTMTSTINGTSGTITVSAAAATTFTVTAPATATAGAAFNLTVTAKDAYGNTATGYVGTVHFTKSDSGTGATVPVDYTFVAGDHGVHTFTGGVTLVTAGSQTVTATDTTTSSLTGTSGPITVSAATVAAFAVTAPTSAKAGVAFTFVVTAKDAFGNTVTGYLGTVHFTKTDAGTGSAVPANYTFVAGDSGMHTFTGGATLVTVGSQTISATDTVTSSITGTSAAIAVSAAAASHFTVSAPATANAGTAISFTVTALDAFNNTATDYSGTIHFTSTDVKAVLPADAILTNGTGTFSATLKTAGNQTLTATDTFTSSITGTSAAIAVSAVALDHFLVSAPAGATTGTAFSFTVTAVDAYNNATSGYSGTVHFTSSDAAAVLPANSMLTNGVGTFSATLNTSGAQTLTATDTVTSSLTGTSTAIAVRRPGGHHLHAHGHRLHRRLQQTVRQQQCQPDQPLRRRLRRLRRRRRHPGRHVRHHQGLARHRSEQPELHLPQDRCRGWRRHHRSATSRHLHGDHRQRQHCLQGRHRRPARRQQRRH